MEQQVYAGYMQQQNRGTLLPGQTIVVNKYTVQVERYLSQGGFAHVYVVKSSTPISNTTQHVLKRIAVSDEAMLHEVKKEVDIMRLLRGHPNIVNLIDASWLAQPNGQYEVFILMELCSGGGIIDMMNRRLRERLTEAEILQIFVDVCEAVAAMHNLKPALLHRDLKVENILQSSLTRYKLCDFGSSTPVAPRPPASTHEIRALEADLNRHTTLQYRAPEMVDVHLRRPVDEKSDVWALGVLLYKLCYYTTPFEEHGPLAILNVQYRIPPYPVYSSQINSLIASMLRELGAHRPSVFEILNVVHGMRGTKSTFRYNIPPQPSLRSPPQSSSPSGMDSLVSFRTSPVPVVNVNGAAQARQTVLDAIAPMRRGRPPVAPPSLSSSTPKQDQEAGIRKFEEQWNDVRTADVTDNAKDAWGVNISKVQDRGGDVFDGFGDSFVEPSLIKGTPAPAPAPSPLLSATKQVFGATLDAKKDAFEGLGGISRSRETSPTLGEATSGNKPPVTELARPPRLNGISRTPIPPATSTPLSPRIPASRTGLATYHAPTSLSAEERYPSLDALDKGWGSPPASNTPPIHAVSQPDFGSKPAYLSQLHTDKFGLPPSNAAEGVRQPELKSMGAPFKGEARSQQATGTAMRDVRPETVALSQTPMPSARLSSVLDITDKRQLPIGSSPTKYRPSRPALARKHRSSTSIKQTESRPPPQDWLTGDHSTLITSPVESQPQRIKRRTSTTLTPTPPLLSSSVTEISVNTTQNTSVPQPQESSHQKIISADASRKEAPNLTRPPMQTRRPVNNAPRRQDSSSDEAEGPEDVNGRMVNRDGKRRAKSRQSSVHDLVDLYDGAARVPVEKVRTGPPSPVLGRKGQRTSGILVDVSLPTSVPSTTLLSPASILPESRAELANRRSGSSSQEERVSPSASLPDSRERNSRPASRASPGSSAMDRSDKPRPQSMFVFPQSKVSDESAPNLKPPDGPRQRSSPRRGSISDMVDLYENLGGGTKLKNPPAIANKPAGLKVSKTPSPVTSRFPAISPTGTSFPIGQITGMLADHPKPKPQRSPTAGSFSEHPLEPPPSQSTTAKDNFTSRLPRRRSVSPGKPSAGPVRPTPVTSAPSKPAKPASLSIPIPANNITFPSSGPRTPTTEAPVSSPSPERPYQGVSRLIDQWQKKTEEAEASRRSGPRASGRPLGPRMMGRREAGQVGKGT